MTETRTRTRTRRTTGYANVAPFDLLTCLLLIFLILAIVQRPHATPMRIDTLGVMAVKATWKAGSNDDADLWVQDPAGNVVWYGSQDAGLMHLEYDDLGTLVSGTVDGAGQQRIVVQENSERVLVRGAVPGEYTVNVQMYRKSDPAPLKVTIVLWRLRGNDRIVYHRTVVLTRTGQEETAFRFTLDSAANTSGINTLPKRFVSETPSR